MGGSCSTRSVRLSRESAAIKLKTTESSPYVDENYNIGNRDIVTESIKKVDTKALKCIKREIKENSLEFILNNMLMSVQFFSDHKELIHRLQHVAATPQEQEMNKTLLKEETMEFTSPDAILDEVNKNIIFRTMSEYSKSECLVAKRIYVINDLIEVVKSDEIPQYTSIDKPCYQVKIEECKRKGFVRLQQVENNSPILITRHYDENYEPMPGPSSRSDSEYEYSRITDLRTPKPIEPDSTAERRDTLPESCFTHRKIKHVPSGSFNGADDEDVSQEYLANLDENDFLKEVIYINSQGFMKHFQNVVFPTSLGKALGFNEDSIELAKAIPGKIFCDDFDPETVNRSFEIIPAVSIPWPSDQTIEFILGESRPVIIDMKTGNKYKWPTDSMVEEIRNTLTAVLVPKGYAKKKGVNKDAKLEWEIQFPKAERYLEARMSHAQMKCMLLLLTLHKTYIAPVTNQNGLLPEHIRTFMYWECERDYRSWPEHRLGTKILKVIKDLQLKLFLGSLPDYFIKDRDLFENIPKKYLNFAQKVMLNILENPIPYFIKALRNLRYSSGKFYPPLDFKDIYDGLKTKKSAVLVNPNFSQPRLKRRVYNDPEQQIKHLKYVKKKEQIIIERTREKDESLKLELEQQKLSEDDIDLDDPIDKELDIFKTKALLVSFIKHFIDIAKKSTHLATGDQALFYLKQAFYLTQILEDTSEAFLDEMREYRRAIIAEETRIKKKSVRSLPGTEERPPTPLRNSLSFQFNDVSQQLRTNSVRLNNLQPYTNGLQPHPKRNLKPSTVQRSDSHTKNGIPPKRKTVAFLE